MSKEESLVDIELIKKMLYNDENYIKEFANASLQSFKEFRDQFKASLLSREMDDLRRAGHKIKPVAQMLHLSPIIEMYEKSKILLTENASNQKLTELAEDMDEYCNRVLSEFRDIS